MIEFKIQTEDGKFYFLKQKKSIWYIIGEFSFSKQTEFEFWNIRGYEIEEFVNLNSYDNIKNTQFFFWINEGHEKGRAHGSKGPIIGLWKKTGLFSGFKKIFGPEDVKAVYNIWTKAKGPYTLERESNGNWFIHKDGRWPIVSFGDIDPKNISLKDIDKIKEETIFFSINGKNTYLVGSVHKIKLVRTTA
ncbi:MAG: hypothetical protein Q8Q35_03085 [Nanoarchaeota archaeon]|nr:hypothetical protein [Nanoarchaeota archaeon]